MSAPSLETARPTAGAPQDAISPRVTSEIDPLRQVIVHTPGIEMELVSPDNREELLFEDILYVSQAREEHRRMCAVFEKLVGRPEGVLQMATLLREALDVPDAREAFVDAVVRVSAGRNLQAFAADLKKLSPDELCDFALTGRSPLPIYLPPVPNLLFTRDVAAVVHDHVIMSHAATSARSRESIITNVVLRYNPRLATSRENLIQIPMGTTFEGGDLLVAAPNVVLIGHSERTSFSGIVSIAQALFERTPVEHVVMVDLPKERYCMHLDTVFTFCSADECAIYAPAIDGCEGNIVHLTPSDMDGHFLTQTRPNLKGTLEDLLGRELTFIPCGGTEPLSQQREQWTDGANFFAPAPGVVVGYGRNDRTFAMMREHGYRVVSAEGFLSYYEQSDFKLGDKLAIRLEGNELSRGRGGPRCMTMPVARESTGGGTA